MNPHLLMPILLVETAWYLSVATLLLRACTAPKKPSLPDRAAC
jgi:hypothetical protein